MSTITTTTTTLSTAYGSQRKIDRCQNGVVWAVHQRGQAASAATYPWRTSYSTNNGATWTDGPLIENGSAGTNYPYTPNLSMFIDLDDYCHVVFKDNHDGLIYYRRGTPNAGRTSWTWSGVTTIAAAVQFDYPDLVVHREGTGWKVHIVYSYADSGWNSNVMKYCRLDVSSGGVVTVDTNITNSADGANGTQHTFPSIDFNHTGNAKTVAGGTPHIYTAWSTGTGAGKGVRFKKATYSGGSWTWGTEREIDTGVYTGATTFYGLNCLFDGTRVIMGGTLYTGSATVNRLWERDVADTTTTTRTPPALATYQNVMTYDAAGNIYFIGYYDVSPRIVGYHKWQRSNTTLQSFVSFDTLVTSAAVPYVSAKRGYSGDYIDFVYADGASNPYSVLYGGLSLNELPTTPTGISVTGTNAAAAIAVVWTHNDPNGNPQAGAQVEVRLASGALERVLTVTGTAQSLNIAAYTLKSGTSYELRVRTADAIGYGAWSSWTAFNTTGRIPGVYVYDGSGFVLVWDLEVTS